jgi:PDZ domain
MKKLVHFVLAVLALSGIAIAQNLPAIDLFGGYSYLRFDQPSSGLTSYQQLKLNGWEFSASVALFHRFSAEADLSGHTQGDCAGVSGVNCTDFSYMFGPRFTVGDRSNRITGFVHGLVGQDRADLLGLSSTAVTDTSIALAAGGGVDFWVFRHIGLQAGPADFFYTNHLNNSGASSQSSFRVAGGIAFRFGGDFPPPEPKQPKAEKESKSEGGHRSWIRPWHKSRPTTTEGQPSETQPVESVPSTAPAHKLTPPSTPVPTTTPSRGMPVRPLGIVAAPQEFDGARILQIEPGSVAEMASLHVGDLITSVDGKAVRTPMELAAELSGKTGKVRIGIVRGKLVTETVLMLSAQ